MACAGQLAEPRTHGGHLSEEDRRAVGHGGCSKRGIHLRGGEHRSREQVERTSGISLAGNPTQRRAVALGQPEGFEREVHRLIRRGGGTDERAKAREAKMAIELELAGRARNHGQIVARLPAKLHGMFKERGEEERAAKTRGDGEQSSLNGSPTGGQILVEPRHLGVERERPVPPHRHHAGQPVFLERNHVVVLAVETVHKPAIGIGWVLGNLVDEGLVVKAMDGLEFPFLGRDLQLQ